MSIPGLEVDLDRVGEICRRRGVARLDVFGSASRGELTALSDVDLLYELAPGARLGWEIEDLAQELSLAFGRTADLVSRASLNRHLRTAVLAEARVLYAA